MSSDKSSVYWPEVCVGCGSEKPSMKDVSFKWKSTESTMQGTKTVWRMRSMKAHVHLCDECAEESKKLRKEGQASADWNMWLMSILFVVIVPTFLIAISTILLPYEYENSITMIPIILLVFYPIFAIVATLTNTREVLRERANPASAFLKINPPSTHTDMDIQVRNENFATIFKHLNPQLDIRHNPSLGGKYSYLEKEKKKRVALRLTPTFIAGALITLLVLSSLPPPTGPPPVIEFTSIQDINDGLVPVGTNVTVQGEVTSHSTWGFTIAENSSFLNILWSEALPSIGAQVMVIGLVQSAMVLEDVTVVEEI